MEKKKLDVVTLTFHQSDNYGAVLQAYALQTKIRKLGYSTQILNYFSEGVNFWNKKITFKTDGYNLRTFKSIIWQFLRRHKHANFDHFRSYLELTEPYFDTTISNAGNIAGVYIVGSDQVWNCDCTFEDYHYFLDFVEDDFKIVTLQALDIVPFLRNMLNLVKNIYVDLIKLLSEKKMELIL